MARQYKRSDGDVANIASCAAAHTIGDLVIENGFVGVCQQTNLINAANVLQIEGRFRVKVPGSTAQGDYLYAAGAPPTNGNLISNLTTTNLTKTSASNTLVAQIMDSPASGLADVKLLSQQSGKK